jgi:putative acetyltransferase
MLIEKATEKDFLEIIEVWEASVRATHLFLEEAYIGFMKPLILKEYLKMVDLYCTRNDTQQIIGFLGVADDKMEMLFIHPEYFGKGIGRQFTEYAINSLNISKVDVNEQNTQAVGFYQKMGFQTVGRTKVDGLGKPYPILEMSL